MGFWQRVGLAMLLGVPGIIVLVLVGNLPEGLSPLLLAINPLIFLSIAAIVGAWAAPKVGLKSWSLTGAPMNTVSLMQVAIAGMVVGAVLAPFDHWTSSVWNVGVIPAQTMLNPPDFKALVFGVTYGGMTEEILMRWGLMSVLMLGLMKVASRQTAGILAILITAAVFAAGHLPALFLSTPDVPAILLIRVLAYNAVLGIWFGWLYLNRDLESAMKAHAGFHIGLFLIGFAA